MRPVPPKALRQVQQFLATSAPPYDFAAHYDTLAPEAMVLIGSQAVRARELTREAFAQRLLQFQEAAGVETFGPGFSLAIVQEWLPDAEGGVMLAGIKENASKANLTALFRLEGERLLVRAATLGGKPLPKPDQVIARSLAEIAHWRPTTDRDVWPLHSLSLGWLRRQTTSTEPLLALPEARFTCQNSGFCCSQIGQWEVTVHGNVVKAMSAVPWAGLGTIGPQFRPAKHPDAKRTDTLWAFDGCAGGGCAAHVGGGCSVHRAAGWQPIEPCLVFPYQFMATPDGICVTCSYICHSVGGNVGAPLATQETDIRQRLLAVRPLVETLPDHIPLLRGGAELTWEAYRRLETVLLDMLADRDRGPLPQRLLAAHQLMTAVMTVFRYTQQVDLAAVEHVLATPLPDVALVPSQFADELMQRALKPLAHPAPLQADKLFGDWHLKGWQVGRSKPLGEALDDEMATRYLRTVLYRKLGLGKAGLSFVWSTVAWAFRAWERQARFLEAATGRPVDRDLQLDVVRHIDTQLVGTSFLTVLSNSEAAYTRYTSPRMWLSLLEA
jgi:hypothetical protein